MVYVSCTQERKDNGIDIFYHDKLDRILFLGFFMSSPITMGKSLKFLACLLTFRSEGRHWNINPEHCPPCKSKRHRLNRKTQQQISDGCKSWRDSCSASCQTTKTKRYKESQRHSTFWDQELGSDPVYESSTQSCLLAPWECHPSAIFPIPHVFFETAPCMLSSISLVPSHSMSPHFINWSKLHFTAKQIIVFRQTFMQDTFTTTCKGIGSLPFFRNMAGKKRACTCEIAYLKILELGYCRSKTVFSPQVLLPTLCWIDQSSAIENGKKKRKREGCVHYHHECGFETEAYCGQQAAAWQRWVSVVGWGLPCSQLCEDPHTKGAGDDESDHQ